MPNPFTMIISAMIGAVIGFVVCAILNVGDDEEEENEK